MYGTILGDIVGSVYEFNNVKSKSFKILGDVSHFTDDTVMSIAVADGLMKAIIDDKIDNEKVTKDLIINAMHRWGYRYPDAGYGGMFKRWLKSSREPYNSWGNGSAMRVSSVGWLFDDINTTRRIARWTAEVTHNHPEGVKGAEAIASAIFFARCGWLKPQIKDYIEKEFGYDLVRSCDEIRPSYGFDVSCQGSVPEAIISFLEGRDMIDTIRNAVSLGGDSDTIAAMAGSVAEAYYMESYWSRSFMATIHKKLTDEMLKVIEEFDKFRKKRINKEDNAPYIFPPRIRLLPEEERVIAEHYYDITGNRKKTSWDLIITIEELDTILEKVKMFESETDIISYLNELSPIKVTRAKEKRNLGILCGTGFTPEDRIVEHILSEVEEDLSVEQIAAVTGMDIRSARRSLSRVKGRMGTAYGMKKSLWSE